VSDERQLPPSDRTDIEPQGIFESNADYFRRLLRENHGIDPDLTAQKAKPWRRWRGQPSVIEAIDEIFDARAPREPGEEG
jgi:hypothetical protein